jgi:hypothetical protein
MVFGRPQRYLDLSPLCPHPDEPMKPLRVLAAAALAALSAACAGEIAAPALQPGPGSTSVVPEGTSDPAEDELDRSGLLGSTGGK